MKTASHKALRRVGFFSLALLLIAGCGTPRDVEVELQHVGFDPASRSPVVVLVDTRRRAALPIWIGSAEAQAIALEFEGHKPSRPMTHDLFRDTLQGAGVSLDRVVIENLVEGTYFARMHMRSLRRDFSVDARPSDAIALAVRFERPIFVAAKLMEAAARMPPELAGGDREVMSAAGLTVQSLTAGLALHFGLDAQRSGVVITDVARAAHDDLQRGDVITAVDGVAVQTAEEFVRTLVGSERRRRTLSIWRDDHEREVGFLPYAGR